MGHRHGGSGRGCCSPIILPLLILCMIGALFSAKSRSTDTTHASTGSTAFVATTGTGDETSASTAERITAGMGEESTASSTPAVASDFSSVDGSSPETGWQTETQASASANPSSKTLLETQPVSDAASDSKPATSFDFSKVPAYSGSPTVAVNDGVQFFLSSDLSTNSFETYGELDSLGRCTATFACVGTDLMPTEPRGTNGPVKPTGWHLVKYAGIDGNYLYNRCPLIAYKNTGENDNVRNLITGTRYMNVDGMLPYGKRQIGRLV